MIIDQEKMVDFFIIMDACKFCFISAVLFKDYVFFHSHHHFSSSEDTEKCLPQVNGSKREN